MIRQAINCDICGAEKQTSNYWFVAYEQGGELRLRGWESPQSSRKGAKHLCGQKCAQRLTANFMASLMATVHSSEQGGELASEAIEIVAKGVEMELISRRSERAEGAARTERIDRAGSIHPADPTDRLERTDRSLVGRANVNVDELEAESWAGPVRLKDEPWETQGKRLPERENYLHAPRIKTSALNRLQRMV